MTTRSPFKVAMVGPPAHPAFLDALADECHLVRIPPDEPAERALERIAECDAYYIRSTTDETDPALHVDGAFLARVPRLLAVVSYGAGFDTVDVPACTAHGVGVFAQVGGNAQAVAEHALGFILAALKRMPEAGAAIRDGTAADRDRYMGRELFGKTVGIVGLGHTGGRLASLLAPFECEVLAADPYIDAETCAARGAAKTDLADLLARSDVVSLHCPRNAETIGMISADALGLMRPGAVLVSTARGGIHDEDAVLAALESGRLAGAALDVWQREPPAPTHPLLAHPAVLATSHTAGVTHEGRARVGTMSAEVLAVAARGTVPPRLVNEAVRDVLAQRLAARV